MVDVPAAVELDRTLEGDHGRGVALRLGVGVLLEASVVVGHVGVVVLRVVDLSARRGWGEGGGRVGL